MEVNETVSDLDIKNPSTQDFLEQLLNQELQSPPPCLHVTDDYGYAGSQSQGPYCGPQESPRSFDCPSIEITSISHNVHAEADSNLEALAAGGAEGGYFEPPWHRNHLYLPLDACYREATLSPSPCSSLSSRSWVSDLSSCESFSHLNNNVDEELHDAALLDLGSPGCGGGTFGVELWQQKYQHPLPFSPVLSPHQSPRQSPSHSPRTSITEDTLLNHRPASRPSSRPTSPCGKRSHSGADLRARSPSPLHSASPSPGVSPRGSATDDNRVGSPASTSGAYISNYQELDVPSKTRRTSGSHLGLLAGDPKSYLDSCGEEKREQGGIAELFLPVPFNFSWNKPKPENPPLFSRSSPPPLDWPLPNQWNQTELKVEVQPKSYHRAHYETEGSRGSIKAAAGGHPVVRLNGYSEQPLSLLLFIGTSDDQYPRPHSFYKVHKVTGKTVTTVCQEKVMGSTKVLDVALLPENNMSVSVNCAGILKLRNADIELKKGETDVGRKNTRVRVVFRVAVPQQDGQMLWLQTASVPIECSQRSGLELPQVESFYPTSCSVEGDVELLISGSNMAAQSRVVFMEKGPDGRSLWETDARVLPEKSNDSRIAVVVPPYKKKAASPVQVEFYVSNGKKRRSPTQSFTFLPGVRPHYAAGPGVKQEHWGADHILYQPLPQDRLDVASYDACLHRPHPASSSLPLQASVMFPSAPTRSLTLLQKPELIHAQDSGPPVQILHAPCPLSFDGQLRKPRLGSSDTFLSPASTPAELLSIKQEPEEQPTLGSLGLQEITLDDVNEIIHRDIGGLSGSAEPDQLRQYGWEHESSTRSFCRDLQ